MAGMMEKSASLAPARWLAASCLAVALAACSGGEQGVTSGSAGNPVIVLSEGECDVTCPVYDMTLHPDGTYLLNGVRFVKTAGVSEGALGSEAWTAAEQALEASGFWHLPPDQTSSDQPTCQPGTPTATITWRTAEGRQKTLKYRPGCGGSEGRALIPALRTALHFDDLVWTDARFAPDGSQ
jgi:Domain of unknown function (DUF6438)